MDRYIQLLTELYETVPGGVCPSHNHEHGIAVMNHAISAIQYYSVSEHDRLMVCIAALLHDADDRKLFGGNPEECLNTRKIMTQCGHDEHDIEIVIRMINLVSASKNRDTIPDDVPEWYLVPRYADRLEAIGEVGIQRTIQFNNTHNMPIVVDSTPLLTTEDDVRRYIQDNRARYENYSRSLSLIDHFYDKLFYITEFPIDNQYFNEHTANALDRMVKYVVEVSREHV